MILVGVYGLIFYLPAEVAMILRKPASLEVGSISAIPWVCALAATFWLPRIADRWNKHRQLAALALLISGCASLAFPTCGPATALVALSIGASGFITAQPLFWTFPTGYLVGSAAAGGIAIINAIGAVGGLLAPNAKVWADARFGSPRAGFYLLAGLTLLNAGLIALMRPRRLPTTP